MRLAKKRVHWFENNKITGETHDEDVDIYTSADAVTCDDGETLQEKIDNREFVSAIDLGNHIADINNPHNITPDIIGAYNKQYIDALVSKLISNDTVLSSNIDFAEVAKWADGNPSIEDRVGYFVTVSKTSSGITMTKANSDSDIRGVTVATPAFAANASVDKFDDGNLSHEYGYVAFTGFGIVYDYGRCTVNTRCMSDDNGCAIPSTNTMGYQVIERIDDNRILILIEPNIDMLNRIKTDIIELEKKIIAGSSGFIGEDDDLTYEFGKDEVGIFYRSIDV